MSMISFNPGRFDTLVIFERKSGARQASTNRPANTWLPVVYRDGSPTEPLPMPVEWEDVLPSSGQSDERQNYGLVLGSTRTRIRMRYRSDIDATCRLYKKSEPGIYYQIVAGPGQIGRREGLEFIIERFTTT